MNYGQKKIFNQIGGTKSKLREEEITRKFAYSSIVAIKDIKKGEKLSKNNLWAKRPGTGDFIATEYFKIIEKKIKTSIKKDEQIKKKNIYFS